MTEVEWLSWPTPSALLQHLAAHPGLASERKLRLFGVACLRRLLPLLTHDVSRAALDVAERYADGKATRDEVARAARDLTARQAADPRTSSVDIFLGDSICRLCKAPLRGSDLESAISYAFSLAWFVDRRQTTRVEASAQAVLLRDVVANPFRPLRVEPAWLTWDHGLVPALAQTIYLERAFDRLPILADALEDAGCDDLELLAHLRGPTDHVRGCWALDRVLERE